MVSVDRVLPRLHLDIHVSGTHHRAMVGGGETILLHHHQAEAHHLGPAPRLAPGPGRQHHHAISRQIPGRQATVHVDNLGRGQRRAAVDGFLTAIDHSIHHHGVSLLAHLLHHEAPAENIESSRNPAEENHDRSPRRIFGVGRRMATGSDHLHADEIWHPRCERCDQRVLCDDNVFKQLRQSIPVRCLQRAVSTRVQCDIR